MFERFTDRARRVLVLAQEEARLLNHSFIGTEHILLGLVSEGEGIAARALESLDVSLAAVREKVHESVGPVARGEPTGSPPFTPRAKKVLELALREALQLGHNYIGTEHILLGIVREGEGVAAQVLLSLGVEPSTVRQRVVQLLGGHQGRGTKRPPGGGRRFSEGSRELFGTLRRGPEAAVVGDEWSATVVRAGRRPSDYAAAYAALAALAARMGISLDAPGALPVEITTVETDEGPGIELSFRHSAVRQPAGGEPSSTGSEQPATGEAEPAADEHDEGDEDQGQGD